MTAAGGTLEIERVWVLRSMPTVPQGAERWEVDQGYLPTSAPLKGAGETAADFPEGRLRRILRPDGTESFRHTIKRGTGMVREETERSIDAEEFRRWWPSTQGRRIAKTRYRIRERDLVWELDEFHDLPLVMLEVELPHTTHAIELPTWAQTLVVREVTNDARYRNAALAMTGMPTPP
ncbi:MAG: hypothetical protein JNL80_07205 [Phycisphaerae bacterium]|nr:hypothetical protein [Phycisphaerae bacterium]